MANRIKESNITPGSVTSDKIAPGTISASNIGPATITGSNIAANTIASSNIAPGTIANDRLANTGITINGTTIALGASGTIVAGTDWQSVFVGDGSTELTTVAGEGYFIDTTSGAVTVNLPSSPSAGDTVVLKDYARTWGTNNVTIASALLDGATDTNVFNTSGQTVTLVYMDGTKGWSLINEDTTSKLENPPVFISATGGTVATSGDYKIHSFTGDGCFVVSTIGNVASNPLGGPAVVDYLVVAGGGSGGTRYSGGGGGGGYRESHSVPVSGCYTASPLATPTGITVSATTYPITVGAGAAGVSEGSPTCVSGNRGSNSVFATITATGGGGGVKQDSTAPAEPQSPGGSGGGGSYNPGPAGLGNTPPTSPSQGNPGGTGQGNPFYSSGGGGGATTAGTNGGTSCNGTGGAGATSCITGSPVGRSGGGGAGKTINHPTGAGGGSPCGSGTGGGTTPGSTTSSAAANRGGGSGGGHGYPGNSGNGGKGIVVIRYKYQ